MSASASERLVDRSVAGFLDDVASGEPVPGGGSVAALTGAASAGLLQMVCGVFLSRPRYADRVAEIRPMLSRAEGLRERLTRLVDADATAYLGLVR